MTTDHDYECIIFEVFEDDFKKKEVLEVSKEQTIVDRETSSAGRNPNKLCGYTQTQLTLTDTHPKTLDLQERTFLKTNIDPDQI
ncbi:hypothetical protein E5288_WYG021400 [Bos mutus]|uniref:Uncharacterized protein n=1 Tax=Bos mutus TaxID=72004 RepID=A0A6B0RE95_9CETA|nr:hypothetical protein [Bos mutus]